MSLSREAIREMIAVGEERVHVCDKDSRFTQEIARLGQLGLGWVYLAVEP